MTGSIAPTQRIGAWQRALVASELYESGGARSHGDLVRDLALIAVSMGVGAMVLGAVWSHRDMLVNTLDLAVGTTVCLSLWARRRRPVPVAVFSIATAAFSGVAAGAALASLFNAATRARVRPLVGLVLLSFTASALFPLLNTSVPLTFRQRFPGFMATAIAVGWGLFVRVRRELIISLRERAERLETEQHQRVEDAREAERRRIAREMHDVLAHRLSLLSLQAGALELRGDASAEEIAQAAAIRTSAATAVEELRQVISVLREDRAGTAPPEPTLSELPALLDESRATGTPVRGRIDVAEATMVPDAIGRTVYRVVQEGLTNARKHAPGSAVDVTVRLGVPDSLIVDVTTHTGPHAPTATTGGTGLIGLAERVALVGGQLEHGPDGQSRFHLRATLPVST